MGFRARKFVGASVSRDRACQRECNHLATSEAPNPTHLPRLAMLSAHRKLAVLGNCRFLVPVVPLVSTTSIRKNCEKEANLFFIFNKLPLKRTHFGRQRRNLDSAAWKSAQTNSLEVNQFSCQRTAARFTSRLYYTAGESRIYRKVALKCGKHWILAS